MWSELTRQLVKAAYEEDLGRMGDITSALLPGGDEAVSPRVTARKPGVIGGVLLVPLLCEVFGQRLGAELTVEPQLHDGDRVDAGDVVAQLRGPQAALLTVERTLLNFLGRMGGVATLTRRFVDAAHAVNPEVAILDTRKTLPGWRELDKYAVRCGGGQNHRMGLYDAVLIKDNHIAGVPLAELAGWLETLLKRLPARPSFVEMEVDDLRQFEIVCRVPGLDIVLLDNFSPADLRAAVAHRDAAGLRGRLSLESSGGITLESVREVAATGIDRISVGALTHGAPSLDLGLDL